MGPVSIQEADNVLSQFRCKHAYMKKSVFISHASKDFKVASEICRLLEEHGIPCWIAPRDIPPSGSYGAEISRAIENCSVTLLLFTDHANASRAVANELELSFSKQKVIVPVRLKEVKPSSILEFFISNAQWVDAFHTPLKKRIEEIIHIVQAVEQNKAVPTPIPEQKTWMGECERLLEKAFRYKMLTALGAFFILLGLGVAIYSTLPDAGREQALAESFANSTELMKKISAEFNDLRKKDGLITNPKSYSELYHNTRVLIQRGDAVGALDVFEKLFKFNVNYADPLIDLTIALTKIHGKQGAQKILDDRFKSLLPRAAYLYASQQLSDSALESIGKLDGLDIFAEFPPLAALYLQKLRARLGSRKVNIYSAPWLDLAFAHSLNKVMQHSIESGSYLVYFIDSNRGNDDADRYQRLNEELKFDSGFSVKLRNFSYAEKFPIRTLDLSRSPVGLDYTYYDEGPPRRVIEQSGSHYARGMRAPNTLHLYLWDRFVDNEQPFNICTNKEGVERCVDLNTTSMRCKGPITVETANCLRFEQTLSWDQYLLPRVDANFSPLKVLDSECLSQVNYVLKDGRKVIVPGNKIVATYRPRTKANLEEKINVCGYDLQLNPPSGISTNSDPMDDANVKAIQALEEKLAQTSFAKGNNTRDIELSYNRASCLRIHFSSEVFRQTEGLRPKQIHPISLQREGLARDIGTYPKTPSFISPQFNDETQTCEIVFKNHAQQVFACKVEKIFVSRWSSPESNATAFPDPKTKLACHEILKDNVLRPIPTTLSSDELIDKAVIPIGELTIYEQLTELASGRSETCQTPHVGRIMNWVADYLSLRGLGEGVCGVHLRKDYRIPYYWNGTRDLSVAYRKLLLNSEIRIKGCFTRESKEHFEKKIDAYYEALNKACDSSQEAKSAMEMIRSAENQVIQKTADEE